MLTLIVGPSVLLIRSSYWIQTWRGRVAYVVDARGRTGLGHRASVWCSSCPVSRFIGFSQRSSISYSFFGAGSLVVRWTSLLFVPDIFGGNGSAGQPDYFAHYNLAEVTATSGCWRSIATFAFLTRSRDAAGRAPDVDYVLYFVLLVVGLFATWGSLHAARSPLSPHPALRQHATAEPQHHRRRLRDDGAARAGGSNAPDAATRPRPDSRGERSG